MPIQPRHDAAALVERAAPFARKAQRAAHKAQAQGAARLRWLAGRRVGLAYRLAGRHPATDVPDHVVAERVRAVLGVELKRLGVHGVHVEAIDRVVYLRGSVVLADAPRIEQLVLGVPGVRGVESYLDLLPSGGRPEHEAKPSPALDKMLVAAREEGCRPPMDRTAVLAVLMTFAARIPPGELRHLWSHLPSDVRGFLRPPVPLGETPHRLRQPAALYAAVAAASGLDAGRAEGVTARLLGILHSLVPEDAADVEAVLPGPLKPVWQLAGAL
ncbi:MAG: DUF2267 domain-containing protein [Mycobacteriales bacterium]